MIQAPPITRNPYVGPFSFLAGDENRFFGRSAETSQLLDMIQKKQLTILFGSSGTGKTSLINAKLLPELRRLYFQPIYIRINFSTDDPLETTRKCITRELREWEPNIPDFKPGQTLIEYAACVSVLNGLIKPVIFFDQFEELFTLGSLNDRKKIDEFIRQLGDMVEMRLPEALTSTGALENLVKFSIVLSLRQEWLAFLEDYKNQMPSLLQNRFRLKRFTPSQARQAIMGPANQHDENIISEKAAQIIIRKIGQPSLMWDDNDPDPQIKNISVDPILLSIYCYELFERVKNNLLPSIDEKLVEENAYTTVIRSYYDKKLAGRDHVKALVEDRLLNAAGRRITLPLSKLLEGSTISAKELQLAASETGIIRIYGQGDPRVEIIHDKIAEQVFESRKERHARENEELLNKEAIERRNQAIQAAEKAKKLRKYTVYIFIVSGALILLALVATLIYIESNTQVQSLKKNIANKNATISLKDKTIKEKEAIISLLNDTIGIYSSIRQDLEKNNLNLRLSVSSKDQQITALNQSKTQLEAQVRSLINIRDQYSQTIKILTGNNNQIDSERQNLLRENEDYRERIATLRRENGDITEKLNSSNKQVVYLQKDTDSLQQTNKALQKDISSLRESNSSLSERNSEIQRQVKSLNTENSRLKKETETLKKDLAKCQQINTSPQTQNQQLQTPIDSSKRSKQ
jgi:FtsZ-binding cell division protein ZapB